MEEFKNSPEPLISFRDADIMNTESTVIYGLNLDVYHGDLVYIVGKVGTGKTSIIRTLIAENKLGKGSCKICGYEVSGIKDREIPFLRRKIGVVFQDFQLLMDRSVPSSGSGISTRTTGSGITPGSPKPGTLSPSC
ncbi:MAG: ATP-binding cassette domain-containing protein [Candidatus Cryptobacteroides sp.]